MRGERDRSQLKVIKKRKERMKEEEKRADDYPEPASSLLLTKNTNFQPFQRRFQS